MVNDARVVLLRSIPRDKRGFQSAGVLGRLRNRQDLAIGAQKLHIARWRSGVAYDARAQVSILPLCILEVYEGADTVL